MEKSHQTESQRDKKSKKSPGGASHSQNQSDASPHDLSGQGLKLNTSLDRSGGNLQGTRAEAGQAAIEPSPNVSGVYQISELSRIGSMIADQRNVF